VKISLKSEHCVNIVPFTKYILDLTIGNLGQDTLVLVIGWSNVTVIIDKLIHCQTFKIMNFLFH